MRVSRSIKKERASGSAVRSRLRMPNPWVSISPQYHTSTSLSRGMSERRSMPYPRPKMTRLFGSHCSQMGRHSSWMGSVSPPEQDHRASSIRDCRFMAISLHLKPVFSILPTKSPPEYHVLLKRLAVSGEQNFQFLTDG